MGANRKSTRCPGPFGMGCAHSVQRTGMPSVLIAFARNPLEFTRLALRDPMQLVARRKPAPGLSLNSIAMLLQASWLRMPVLL